MEWGKQLQQLQLVLLTNGRPLHLGQQVVELLVIHHRHDALHLLSADIHVQDAPVWQPAWDTTQIEARQGGSGSTLKPNMTLTAPVCGMYGMRHAC